MFWFFGVFDKFDFLTWSLETALMHFSDFLIFVRRLVKSSTNFEETIKFDFWSKGLFDTNFLGFFYWLLEWVLAVLEIVTLDEWFDLPLL